MYLMNVPPAAAIHPEWRSCGPPRGYSLPLCFHDSDSELSTTGTPIPEKVQMIIESLRSSQSSLDMGDKVEANALPAPEAHPQARKARASGPVASALKSKSEAPAERRRRPDVSSSPVSSPESRDSDSDGSVDRGIEEAILEYLKEKDNHKRKAEPATDILPPCKIPRKDPAAPDFSKQHSDSNKVLTASIQVPKCVKAENHIAPASPKNLLKSKLPFKENPVKKTPSGKGTTTKSVIPLNNQKKLSRKASALFNKIKWPATVKVEEESPESSSDDGIEEAIQRYQLEQKEEKQEATQRYKEEKQEATQRYQLEQKEEKQEAMQRYQLEKEEKQKGNREDLKPPTLKEESDSSSDDGIEEAIRSYQLEQQKEKTVVLKPSLPKQKPVVSKLPVRPVESTSAEQVVKRHKLSRKKKKRTLPPPPSPVGILKGRLPDSPEGKGNGELPSKVETLGEQQQQQPLATLTTAELMCAEAILDISKAVMPEVFNPNVGIVARPPSALVPSARPGDESDDSSVDSEDGIEQEIRKFLEQKAQIHKQPPDSAAAAAATDVAQGGVSELDAVKSKQSVSQKKVLRLSLAQRRRQKEEERKQIPKEPATDHQTKEDAPLQSSPEREKGSSPPPSPLGMNPPQPAAGPDKTEQSGDKSSSLDSDEDLDTAIKDLLKTKKKLKKKTRDMKLKSRKCLKDVEPLSVAALQTKKLKPEPISKGGVARKVIQSTDDAAEKLNRKGISQHKHGNKRKEPGIQASETDKSKGQGGAYAPSPDNSRAVVQIKEDSSSSVDSDDSIELEIRKFLAEKAKVSTTERSGDVPGNANAEVCNPIPEKDIKLENQLAEIPRKDVAPLPELSRAAAPERKASQNEEAFPTAHTALLDTPTIRGPCLSSAFSNSPGLLEPADGAGAVRTESKRPSTGSGDYQNVTSEMARARPLVSPSAAQSRSDSIKWRQSLGLPTTEVRGASLGRSPFHISSPKVSEAAPATPAHQRGSVDSKPQTPATACPSAKSSRSLAPFHRSAERPAPSRSPYSAPSSAPPRPPGGYFMQGLTSGTHWTQRPLSARTESVVHVAKDQFAFVELASNKINHVQFRSKETTATYEGKDRGDLPSEREGERDSAETDERGAELGRDEEDCVDETDCESSGRTSPMQEQGFSTLRRALSSAIQHGVTLSPYIALSTQERRRKFNRLYLTVNHQKARAPLYGGTPVSNKVVVCVKRKLQFLPAARKSKLVFQ